MAAETREHCPVSQGGSCVTGAEGRGSRHPRCRWERAPPANGRNLREKCPATTVRGGAHPRAVGPLCAPPSDSCARPKLSDTLLGSPPHAPADGAGGGSAHVSSWVPCAGPTGHPGFQLLSPSQSGSGSGEAVPVGIRATAPSAACGRDRAAPTCSGARSPLGQWTPS